MIEGKIIKKINETQNLELKYILEEVLKLNDKEFDNYNIWDPVSSKTIKELKDLGFLVKTEEKTLINLVWR